MHISFYKVLIAFTMMLSSASYAGIVIESTRYLYKEGTREITAQIENKDNIPYLIKSWVESSQTQPQAFMVTPPLFRLEAKQKNTVRLFATGNVNAPADRETIFYFNVMSIPPTDETYANSNTVQLAVRHRMRLIYRPKQLFEKSINAEAKKIQWYKSGNKIKIKNDTPFFYYFNSIKLGNREIKQEISSIPPFSTKEIELKEKINSNNISWRVMNDYGGIGSLYSSKL